MSGKIGPTIYVYLAILAIIALGALVFSVLFLFVFPASLARTLSEVRERNRFLASKLVWLHLLHLGPVLSLLGATGAVNRSELTILFGTITGLPAAVCDLVMVLKISASLKQVYEDRGWDTAGIVFGRSVGLMWTVSFLLMWLVGLIQLGARVVTSWSGYGILFHFLGPGGFVAWLMYWVQTSRCRQRLRENQPNAHRTGSIEADYDDQFHRPSQIDKTSAAVNGTTLEAIMGSRHRGQLPVALSIRYVRKLAADLASMHSQGVTHGNVRPQSVKVYENDDPQLIGASAAGCIDRNSDRSQSEAGVIRHAYMAPEQVDGNPTAASDQYSLGCILYELLTGKTPFVAKLAGEPASTDERWVESTRTFRRIVSRDLDAICLKCLSPDVGRRYGSMDELANDLDRYAQGKPVAARPLGRGMRVAKWMRRHPILTVTCPPLFVFVACIAISSAIPSLREPVKIDPGSPFPLPATTRVSGALPSPATDYQDPVYLNAARLSRNLLKNGSFEEAPQSGWVVRSWRMNPRASAIVTDHSRSGKGSAILRSGQSDDCMFAQKVTVKPEKRYLLCGWVQSKDVVIVDRAGQMGANLSVWGGFESSQSIVGTMDWTYLTLVFNSGGRTEVEVGCRLGHHGSLASGTAWFDDLVLIELP